MERCLTRDDRYLIKLKYIDYLEVFLQHDMQHLKNDASMDNLT